MGRIRVLVVDDSPLVRKTVGEFIDRNQEMEVVGFASNGREALEQVTKVAPDVVTLDLDMPLMDGMSCLGPLVREHQQRVVILSTLALENAFPTFKALALGAIDFVTKPGTGRYLSTLKQLGQELTEKIRVAAGVPRNKIRVATRNRKEQPATEAQPSRPLELRAVPKERAVSPPRMIVGIGGSTGGTVTLEALFRRLPGDLPASIIVVQHMPQGFSKSLARYLDSVTPLEVKVGEDRELIRPKTVYLAPGGKHLCIQRSGLELRLRTDSVTPAQQGFRPSINTLFYSLATAQRHRTLGVLLSGMGDDGANGLKAIRKLGGRTVVQDRSSSIVFGMAARALEIGAVDKVVPAGTLADELVTRLGGQNPSSQVS